MPEIFSLIAHLVEEPGIGEATFYRTLGKREVAVDEDIYLSHHVLFEKPAIAILSKGSRFCSSVKDAPSEISTLVGETAALSGLLSALRNQVDRYAANATSATASGNRILPLLAAPAPQGSGSNPQLMPGILGEAQMTLQEVEHVIEKLETQPDEWLKNAAKRAIWTFKEREVKALLAKLDRHKSSFQLAISMDGMSALQEILDGTNAILQSVNANDEAKEVLKWLSPVQPKYIHDATSNLYQPGTGLWLYNTFEFKKWLEGEENFLWLSGIGAVFHTSFERVHLTFVSAGSGKSVLASTVINYLQSHTPSGDAIIFWYCDFKDNQTQDINNLFGFLVSQLVLQQPCFPESVRLFHEKHHGYPRPPLEERSELLETINSLVASTKSGDHIHLMVTSRKEVDINEQFQGKMAVDIQSADHEVGADVEIYAKAEIQKRKALARLPKNLKETIVSTLLKGSQGMFRWCQCQLDALGKARSEKAVNEMLQNLPPGLFGTYDRILQQVDEAEKEMVSRVLKWLSYSLRPLKLRELAEAIIVEIDQETFDETARFFGEEDCLSVPALLRILANVCFSYLSFEVFVTVDMHNERRGHKYRLYNYASRNALRHASTGRLTPDRENSIWFKKLFVTLPSRQFDNRRFIACSHFKPPNDSPAAILLSERPLSFVQTYFELTGRNFNDPIGTGFAIHHVTGNRNRPEGGAIIRFLVERGVDINQETLGDNKSRDFSIYRLKWKQGHRELQVAITIRFIEGIKTLLDCGAATGANSSGCTALQHAVNEESGVDIIQTLLKYAADDIDTSCSIPMNLFSNTQVGYTPLHITVCHGNKPIVTALLDAGADVDAKTISGLTVLHLAIAGRYFDIIHLLLSRGADVNAQSDRGQTPLHILASHGESGRARRHCICIWLYQDIVSLIPLWKQAGISATVTVTAQQWGGMWKILEYDVYSTNNVSSYLRTSLHFAIETSNDRLLEELLCRGANGNSACVLAHAMRRDYKNPNLKLVQRLINAGADLSTHGWQLLSIASLNRYRVCERVGEIIGFDSRWQCTWKLLVENGAGEKERFEEVLRETLESKHQVLVHALLAAAQRRQVNFDIEQVINTARKICDSEDHVWTLQDWWFRFEGHVPLFNYDTQQIEGGLGWPEMEMSEQLWKEWKIWKEWRECIEARQRELEESERKEREEQQERGRKEWEGQQRREAEMEEWLKEWFIS
ncbi:hypothetical protein K440DRAFT_661610 [Wilcoxina mikolae CBS 423.85]|nr:hypothetical protein K440DRAFT_661610 [Wilcoxina mikolae CBS 423.85]